PCSRTSSPRPPAAGSTREGASGMSAPAADVRAGSLDGLRLLPARAARLRDGTVAMGWAELRKLRHDHLDIFTRSVQPLLWLFVFATPLPRLGIVLGKASGAAIRALAQAIVLFVVIAIAGIGIRWTVWGVVGAVVLLLL